jgi:hypothetical protein
VFVTNHVLSGVIVGRWLPKRPAAAFAVGVGSHLILDAIPHWGCDVGTPLGLERFLSAARKDGLLGVATMTIAALAVDTDVRTSTLAAMTGAVVLDLDKPLIHFLGVNPFPRWVNRIHSRVQNESPGGMHNEIGFGVGFAAFDVVASVVDRHHRQQRFKALQVS